MMFKAFLGPVFEAILEAMDLGVTQESLLRAIKSEMTAIARKEIVDELKEGEPK